MKKYRAQLPDGQGIAYYGNNILAVGIDSTKAASRAAPYAVANAMIDIGEAIPENGSVLVMYRVPVEEYDDGL